MPTEYLLEVRSGEMPPAAIRSALRQLGTRLFESLVGYGLTPVEMVTGATPRRLVVCLIGLPEREADRRERQLGPPIDEAFADDGGPTEALNGFAERVGLPVAELETVKTEKGDYLAADLQVSGRSTAEVLARIVPSILGELSWGKSMISGRPRIPSPPRSNAKLRFRARSAEASSETAWVRPLEGLLSIYDGEILSFELAGLVAGDTTAGHPIASPDSFTVKDFASYRRRLAELDIEIDPAERRRQLIELLGKRAAQDGAEPEEDAMLIEHLAWACERPGVVQSSFDAEHLTLPDEVIRAAVRLQGGLALRIGEELQPNFLVAMDRTDDPRGHVAAGHRRALNGRLVDCRFHDQADRRRPLAARRRSLEQLSFHDRLGSYADKTRRLEALVEVLCHELDWSDLLTPAQQAVQLLKTDLTTEMVHEHGGLRGIMGGIYARDEGYIEQVWQAIYDQYLPHGASSPIPRGPTGCIVALADRLDTLTGIIGLNGQPSSRRDPWQLRRLGQGLLRIVVEADLELDLDLIAARAVLSYGDKLNRGATEILADLRGFFADRLRHLLGGLGFAHDEIEAAMAVGTQSLPDLLARTRALKAGREAGNFRSLILSARRIYNIVKDWAESELKPELLVEEAEKDLYAVFVTVRDAVAAAVQDRRYEDGLRQMEALAVPLDRFFNEVLVVAEDEGLRDNRIALLQSIRRVFWRIGRFKAMTVD